MTSRMLVADASPSPKKRTSPPDPAIAFLLRNIDSDKCFSKVCHSSSSFDEDRLGPSEQSSDAQWSSRLTDRGGHADSDLLCDKVRPLNQHLALKASMPVATHQSEAPTAPCRSWRNLRLIGTEARNGGSPRCRVVVVRRRRSIRWWPATAPDCWRDLPSSRGRRRRGLGSAFRSS